MARGLFLAIVGNLVIWKIQAGWKDTISFAVLIAFLLFRAGGIFNVKAEAERVWDPRQLDFGQQPGYYENRR